MTDDAWLRDGSHTSKRPEHLPQPVTIGSTLQAFSAKLTDLNDRQLRMGLPIVAEQDPRHIAGQIQGMSDLLRVSTILRPQDGSDPTDLLHAVGAQLLALRLALHREDQLRVDTGDEAA